MDINSSITQLSSKLQTNTVSEQQVSDFTLKLSKQTNVSFFARIFFGDTAKKLTVSSTIDLLKILSKIEKTENLPIETKKNIQKIETLAVRKLNIMSTREKRALIKELNTNSLEAQAVRQKIFPHLYAAPINSKAQWISDEQKINQTIEKAQTELAEKPGQIQQLKEEKEKLQDKIKTLENTGADKSPEMRKLNNQLYTVDRDLSRAEEELAALPRIIERYQNKAQDLQEGKKVKIPKYHHFTQEKDILANILNSGEIRYAHQGRYAGAYVANQTGTSYGSWGVVMHGSKLEHSKKGLTSKKITSWGDNAVWVGINKNISLIKSKGTDSQNKEFSIVYVVVPSLGQAERKKAAEQKKSADEASLAAEIKDKERPISTATERPLSTSATAPSDSTLSVAERYQNNYEEQKKGLFSSSPGLADRLKNATIVTGLELELEMKYLNEIEGRYVPKEWSHTKISKA